MNAIDLFAGPGGWDVGARELGIDPLGIEWDDAACQTRAAAGLRTHQGDVAALDPHDFAPCDLLIASPPCQAWSMAGKRKGADDITRVHALTNEIASGGEPMDPDLWRTCFGEWSDPRSKLVTEPLRWALALEPDLIAWEQVPPVLDYWKHCASILRERGYGTWAGILSAERYGVPQTRKRAILMASLAGPVHPPQPTHQEYRSGEPAWDHPQMTLEGELLPWVSMATALGWTGAGVVNTRCDRQTPGGNEFPPTQPSWALTEKARSWTLRANAQDNSATRDSDEPAPTSASQGLAKGRDVIRFRAARVERQTSRPAPTIVTTRRSDKGLVVGRQLPEGEGRNVGGHGWGEKGDPSERPATTVAGDPRIPPPGHHGHSEQGGPDAIRVSIEEAAVLQGFDPHYPWQGSRTKQFEQVGNAVPPPLARAILESLTKEDQ